MVNSIIKPFLVLLLTFSFLIPQKTYEFTEEEMKFLLNKMFVNVTILHPIKKRELSCSGKVNDYELD